MAIGLMHDEHDTRFRIELRTGDTTSAVKLKQREAPPHALVQQVDAAVRFEDSERERLAGLELDGDRRVGLQTRRLLLAGFGLAWLVFWGGVAWSPPLTVLPLLQFFAGYTLAGVAMVLPLRKTMLEHRLNRQMLLVYLAMLLGSVATSAVALEWGLPVARTLVLLMLAWALGMGALAALLELASAVPSVVWLGGALVAARWPGQGSACLAVGAVTHVAWPLLVSLRLTRREGAARRRASAAPPTDAAR
jgi:hypothetical protein